MTPYMAPVFEALAQRCDLTVLFGSKTGSRAMAWTLATPSSATASSAGRRSPEHRRRRYLSQSARAGGAVAGEAGRRDQRRLSPSPPSTPPPYCRTSRARLLVQSDGTASRRRASGATSASRGRCSRAPPTVRLATPDWPRAGWPSCGFRTGVRGAAQHRHRGFPRGRPSPGGACRRRAAGPSPSGACCRRRASICSLRAVARRGRAGASVALTIVGEGDDGPRLRALAGELALDRRGVARLRRAGRAFRPSWRAPTSSRFPPSGTPSGSPSWRPPRPGCPSSARPTPGPPGPCRGTARPASSRDSRAPLRASPYAARRDAGSAARAGPAIAARRTPARHGRRLRCARPRGVARR